MTQAEKGHTPAAMRPSAPGPIVDHAGIGGSPVDMSIFATNVTDEEYQTYVTGNWGTGFELGQVGPPRMYGMRLRYNF